MGLVLGPHARTDRTRNTRVAEPWLLAPEDGRQGEGQRLTPEAPHNGGRPPPPGTAFRHPRGTQPPQGMQAKGTVLGPHSHTPAPTARGWRTPTARPVGGRSGERQRLTSDGPHNGGRQPPPGTPFRQPHSEQRRPARAHAVGPVLGPHARTDRSRDTRVAEPWLPTPEDGRLGEGQRLTPDAPHNGGRHPPRGRPSATPRASNAGPQGRTLWGWCRVPTPSQTAPGRHRSENPGRAPQVAGGWERDSACHQRPLTTVAGHPPPGTAPHHPRGTQPPQGMQAKETVLSPHTHTPATTACGWRTPTARPVVGQFREGERLTTDAPHNGGRHPTGNALPPPLQRAAPARKGRRCGAGAGSPRPHRPHLGHTGRRTPTARPRGQAAGGGTAPDTRRPSQQWQATPPKDGPPPAPGHAAPTGHAGQGDSVGPPHPHTRAHSTWVADPNSPPSGRAVGEGGAPDLRRPSQWWKAPPTGMPFCHPHSEQRRPAGAHAVGPVLDPHARTDRTRDTRAAEPQPPAPEDGRPGEKQRLTPDAPHNGGRPPSPGTAPHQPRGTQPPQGMQAKGTVLGPHTHTPAPKACGWRTPTARAVVGQFREGERLTTDAPHNGGRNLPPGTPFCHPQSEQRRPARAHAVEPVLGPHARTDRTRNTRVAVPRLPAPEDGRSGKGQRLTPDAPHNGGRPPPPPGDGTPPPPRHAAPTGHAGQGDSVGPPHPHTRAHSTWVADPNSPPRGRAVRGGGAPDLRRPSQRWKAPPPGTPFGHPHSEQRRPARAHAVGPVLGPHARTDRIRNTRVAGPRPPAPEAGGRGRDSA